MRDAISRSSKAIKKQKRSSAEAFKRKRWAFLME